MAEQSALSLAAPSTTVDVFTIQADAADDRSVGVHVAQMVGDERVYSRHRVTRSSLRNLQFELMPGGDSLSVLAGNYPQGTGVRNVPAGIIRIPLGDDITLERDVVHLTDSGLKTRGRVSTERQQQQQGGPKQGSRADTPRRTDPAPKEGDRVKQAPAAQAQAQAQAEAVSYTHLTLPTTPYV